MSGEQGQPADIHIEVVSGLKGLRELEGDWNDLLARSGSDGPFLTFEWFLSWWEVFGKGRDLVLQIARKGGEIIGIAPFMGHRSFIPGCRVGGVEFIGAPDADYHDFIIAEERETVIRLFLRALLEAGRYAFVRLSEIPENSPNLYPLRRVLLGEPGVLCSEREKTLCHHLGVDPGLSWELQFRRLKPNMRTSLRRLSNRYAELGELELTRVNSGGLAAGLDDLCRQHVSGWNRRGKRSVLKNPEHREFLEVLGRRFLEKGWIEFSRLAIGGQLVGIHYGFGYKETLYYYLVSHSEGFSLYSPGKMHLYFLIRDAHSRGFRLVDLLRGTESYKTNWTESSRPNYELMVFRRDPVGVGSYLWFEKVKPLLRRSAALSLLRERLRREANRSRDEAH